MQRKPAPADITAFQPKRGRPTKAQVAAIDRVILDVARERFLEAGYANTAMDAIAASAGVSKGTLYARYPDKPALFKAIVTVILAQSSDVFTDQIVFGAGSLPEQLHRFGVTFLERMLSPDALAFEKLFIAEADIFPELAMEFHAQGYDRAVRRLADRIATTTRSNGWPAADPTTLATTFIAALIGWMRPEGRTQPRSQDDRAAFVGRLVALLTGGRAAW